MAIKTLKRANQRRRTQQYRNQQKRTQKGGSGFFSSLTNSLKRNPTIISILKSLIEEKKAVKDAVTALPKQIINLYNVIEKLSTISSSKSSSSKKKTTFNEILFDYFNRKEKATTTTTAAAAAKSSNSIEGDLQLATSGGGGGAVAAIGGELETPRILDKKLADLDKLIILYIDVLYQDMINRSLQPTLVTLYILGLHIPEYYVNGSSAILFSSDNPRWWQLIIQNEVLPQIHAASGSNSNDPLALNAPSVFDLLNNSSSNGGGPAAEAHSLEEDWGLVTIGSAQNAESEHKVALETNSNSFITVLKKLKNLIDDKREKIKLLTKEELELLMNYLGSKKGPSYGSTINKYLIECLQFNEELKKIKSKETPAARRTLIKEKEVNNNKTTHSKIILNFIKKTTELNHRGSRNLATCFNRVAFVLELQYNTTIQLMKSVNPPDKPMWLDALVAKSKEVFGLTDIEQGELESRVNNLHSFTVKELAINPLLTVDEIETRMTALRGGVPTDAELLARFEALQRRPGEGGGSASADGGGGGGGGGGAAADGRKKKKKTKKKKHTKKKRTQPNRRNSRGSKKSKFI